MHCTLTALAALTLSLFIGGAAMAHTDKIKTKTETEIRNKATVQASFDASSTASCSTTFGAGLRRGLKIDLAK